MSRIFTKLNAELSGHTKSVLTASDTKWLDRATTLASTSDYPRFRIGSIIVQSDKKISSGVNSQKTHPFQARWNKKSSCIHAEIKALLDASKNTNFHSPKSTIYVARLLRTNQTACSYPCVHCWGALQYAGIHNIVCYDENDTPTKVCIQA